MTSTWILGSGGLLGSALSEAIGARPDTILFEPSSGSFHWKQTELLRPQLRRAVEEFAQTVTETRGSWMIFWAAGRGTMGSSAEEMSQETATLAELLSLLSEQPILREQHGTFFFASSTGAIYAGTPDDTITERSVPRALSPYGTAKLDQESILTTWAATFPHASVMIGRITNLYGPRQAQDKQQGIISHVARCILTHRPIHIFVPLDTMRDYIHVHDAVADILCALDRADDKGSPLVKIFGSELPTTIAQILGTFRHITHIKPRIVTSGSVLQSQYPHRMCFRSLVLPETRLQNRISLTIGIAEMLRHEQRCLQQGVLIPAY